MGMSEAPFTVCVVGGGFTGAAAGVACLSHLKTPFRLVIIEGTSALGHGLAYGSHRPLNLLNVRTRDLSIRAGQPGDFLNWAFRQLDQGENQAGLHEVCRGNCSANMSARGCSNPSGAGLTSGSPSSLPLRAP